MKCLSVSDTADALDNWQLHASLCMDQIYRYGLRQTPWYTAEVHSGKRQMHSAHELETSREKWGKGQQNGIGKTARRKSKKARRKSNLDLHVVYFTSLIQMTWQLKK